MYTKINKLLAFSTVIFIFNVSIFSADQRFGDYPFFYVNDSEQTGIDNQIQLLHSGVASLQKRLDMIRGAKNTIHIEYFIWKKDKAGLLVFHELIKKAKKGVKVKIIVDKSIAIHKMDEFYAEAVSKYGLELRHYNRALDPITAQFRNHRKVFVVDGKEAITGGRNIGEEYFDMDPIYNFLDRDVYIKGPVAKVMDETFQFNWNHSIVKKAKVLKVNPKSNRLFRDRKNRDRYNLHRGEVLERLRKEANDWIESHQSSNDLAKKVEKVARPILNGHPLLSCPKLTFVSDRPGATFKSTLSQKSYMKNSRSMSKVLFHYIDNKVTEKFYMASPYFIPNKRISEKLESLIDRGVKPYLLVNSLGSTDAFYVSSNFYRMAPRWQKRGLQIYIHDAKYTGHNPVMTKKGKAVRWGMHEKTYIFNDEAFYIGTYNIDNRSDFFNVEMGVICEGSQALTRDLLESMMRRYQNSYKIVGEGRAISFDGEEADYYGNATKKQKKTMKRFSILAKIFEPLM